jgi:glutathione S-transferase
VIRIWGRNTSANVQKVMWTVGELGLACERVDIGGPFGKNREADYLARNPNGLIPTLEEEDGFLLWESNAITRYLAGKHASALEPADPKLRALAQQWMDWQLSVVNGAITPVFWGLVRTPPDKRDLAAIEAGIARTTEVMQILDAQLGKTRFVAGPALSYGDIPLGIMVRRYRDLVPARPRFEHLERWYAEIAARPAFQEHVSGIPLV